MTEQYQKLKETALVIRPLHSLAEYTTYHRLSNTAFSPEPSEENALLQRERALNSPDFRPERVRGAFQETQERLLGCYTIYDRVLRMGAARISTGCLSGVVTTPEARNQGIGRALMRDSQDFGRSQRHSLLLLNGIPKFYYRFGYIDVLDITEMEIDREAILACHWHTSGYQIRPATVADAPAILALYLNRLSDYTGTFERSLELQEYRLQNARHPHVVALSPEGEITGYLIYGKDEEESHGYEVVADGSKSLLALLLYHARLCSGEAAPAALHYLLPPHDYLTHWLIDTLQVTDTSLWDSPLKGWSVRSLGYHHLWAGWMASLLNFPLFRQEMLPELQARWQNSLASWNSAIFLTVNDTTHDLSSNDIQRILRFKGKTLLLEEDSTPRPSRKQDELHLTPQEFLQLTFGYRPLAHLVYSGHLSQKARAALEVLFPAHHGWIPRSDWF